MACEKGFLDCPGGDCEHVLPSSVDHAASDDGDVAFVEEDLMIPEHEVEEGFDDEDKDILQELYRTVKVTKQHTENYLALLAFIAFSALYFTILYLHADSFSTYEVSTAHTAILPDGLTAAGFFTFPSTNALYSWLNDTIIQTVWESARCGNGICDRPVEYASFSRFGCLSDCGSNPNVTEVIMTFTLSFPSTAVMQQSSWNLCMLYPAMLCWYASDTPFTKQSGTFRRSLSIPDGNWTLVLNAPAGGVTGSVTYNGTYQWPSPNAIAPNTTMLSWSICAANTSATALGMCRQTAANIVNCAIGVCTLYGARLATSEQISGLFVDLVGFCNVDVNGLDAVADLDCQGITEYLTEESSNGFQSLRCNSTGAMARAPAPAPAPSRRLLQDGSVWSFGSYAHMASQDMAAMDRRMALAELTTSPSDYTSTLWESLGSTDSQRLLNLGVASQRAVYSWIGDSCLAAYPVHIASSPRFAAFFCTYFGGPATLPGCQYSSSTVPNKTLTTDSDIAQEMKAIHRRFNISLEQSEVFSKIFLNAIQSVVDLDDATLAEFNIRLRQLDLEIVKDETQGCPIARYVLPWSSGLQYETNVTVGDLVTWVWSDDNPHSIRTDGGFGESKNEIFFGMGAGQMIVSRNTICDSDNFGAGNISTLPLPCVLHDPKSSSYTFSFTKAFNETGTFYYGDGRDPVSTYGTINVQLSQSDADGGDNSLSLECAPGCKVGSLRDGLCHPACNNLQCAFDGGDCSCPQNSFGISQCTCPSGQTTGRDGTCCESFGVGTGLSFPFSILTWGPNVTETDADFLPQSSPPRYRYIANHNRVLVGMLITQTRWKTVECKKKFSFLFPNCTEGASEKSYGVNPVFLPLSVLYNKRFADNPTSYYSNYSLGFDNSTLWNAQGIPYGFDPFDYKQKTPTFAYMFDVNYNNEEATEALQYLVDGYFIDNATKEVNVRLITYNGIAHKFTMATVTVHFQSGGKVPATFDIQSVNTEPYRTDLDQFRFVLEIVFIACVGWAILIEFRAMWKAYRREGSIFAYFTYFWSAVDVISLSIMIGSIFLWLRYTLVLAKPFDIKARYRIYDVSSLSSSGLFWDIVPPGDGFADALSAFERVEAMVYFRTYYVALNGISILLVVLRILKLMDFQPRMGTLTRTIGAAVPDLVHFFMMFFIVFLGFAMFGHLVFGRTLDQFRTLPTCLVTLFEGMLGDDSSTVYLNQLKGWELVAGVVFWWSFIIIMTWIVFNLLIAIIVEAFIKVKVESEEAPSMPSEVIWLLQNRTQRLFSSLKTDRKLLRQLAAMGADKMVAQQRERAEWRSKSGRLEAPMELNERKIIKLNDEELTLDELVSVLERAKDRKEVEGERANVDATVVAKVVFEQYSREATEAVEVAENDEAILSDMVNMKEDLQNMTDVILELMGTITELKAERERSKQQDK